MPGTCWIRFVEDSAAREAVEATTRRAGWTIIHREPTPAEQTDAVEIWVDEMVDRSAGIDRFDGQLAWPTLNIWLSQHFELPDGWEDSVREFLADHAAVSHTAPTTTTRPIAQPAPSAAGTSADDVSDPVRWSVMDMSSAPADEIPPASPRSPHVFISYSQDDRDYVDRLVGHLREAEINCWIDTSGIDYGDRWAKEIQIALDTCAVFVVVMTPRSQESRWVTREITWAEKQRKPILPLLLEGDEFFRIADLQYESVVGGTLPSSSWVDHLKGFTRSS